MFRILLGVRDVCLILIEGNNDGERCKHKFGTDVFDSGMNDCKDLVDLGMIDDVNATKFPVSSVLEHKAQVLKPMKASNGPFAT